MRARVRSAVALFALVLLLAATPASAAIRQWTGVDGSWTNGGLWDPAGVPTVGDNLIINQQGQYTCTTDQDFRVSSLVMGGSSGNKTIRLSAGTSLTLEFQGKVNFNASFDVRGSLKTGEVTVNSAGVMYMRNGSSAVGPGDLIVKNAGLVVNEGTAIRGRLVSIEGGVFEQRGSLTLTGGSSITNAGTFAVFQGDLVAPTPDGAGPFLNSGTFDMRTSGTINSDVEFRNSGTVNVGGGTLQTSGASYSQSAGKTSLGGGNLAAPVVLTGGTLTGPGTVSTVTSSGTIALAGPTAIGELRVQGSFTQLAAGIVQIKIGSQSQFDRLIVLGNANLNGQLNVMFLNNFVPSVGTRFPVMTFSSLTGKFRLQAPIRVGNVSLKPVYDRTGLALVVTLPHTRSIRRTGDHVPSASGRRSVRRAH